MLGSHVTGFHELLVPPLMQKLGDGKALVRPEPARAGQSNQIAAKFLAAI